MSDLNQCNFIGRLGSNPEMRTTQSGDAMATFSIAVSEKYNDRNGNRTEKTEWVNIQAFGKLAEIMGQYLSKGSQVFISGKFQSRKFTGQDGVERTAVSILAQSMQMLGGGQNTQQQGQWQGQNTAPQGQWQGQAQGGYNQPPQNAPQGYPQGLSPSPSTAMQRPPSTGTWGGNGSNQYPQNGYQGQAGQPMPITPPNGVADDTMPF